MNYNIKIMVYYTDEQRRRGQMTRQLNAQREKLRDTPEDFYDIWGSKVPRVTEQPNPVDYGVDEHIEQNLKLQDEQYIKETKENRISTSIVTTIAIIIANIIVFYQIYSPDNTSDIGQQTNTALGWIGAIMCIGGLYGLFALWAWAFSVEPKKTYQHERFEEYKRQVSYYEYWLRKKSKNHWNRMSGYGFENAVANLFRGIGCSAETTKRSGDGGVDIIITKGTRKIAVQCKRYNKSVGPHVIRDLLGTMNYLGYEEGAIVTTTGFTSGVKTFANNHKKIYLIDLNDILRSIDNPDYLLKKINT